ncbi:unnamed protein product [Toxocara canis]|uniref:Uncharacterized protein n=1 Tax=Toxocara canis TaxID=6265 RepID=A0A183UQU9_TOXCA|nr:unnamed protein product [Toxocara canis]
MNVRLAGVRPKPARWTHLVARLVGAHRNRHSKSGALPADHTHPLAHSLRSFASANPSRSLIGRIQITKKARNRGIYQRTAAICNDEMTTMCVRVERNGIGWVHAARSIWLKGSAAAVVNHARIDDDDDDDVDGDDDLVCVYVEG